MRLPVLSSARRSGLGLLLVGVIAGVLLTMTVLSITRDAGSESMLQQLGTDDAHLHHQHHHHRHRHSDLGDDGSEKVKVVDLAEQDRHKHQGQTLQPSHEQDQDGRCQLFTIIIIIRDF